MKARTRPNTASNNPHAVCCPECGKARLLFGEAVAERDKALSERDRLREAILRHRADYLKDGVSHNRNLWDVADALRPHREEAP